MVVGFIMLAGLIVYLIISLFMIWISVSAAKANGKSMWKSGLITAVIMYLIMFWDFIPFHVAHKYYCATEGGFTLNKTLEAWKQENPGMVEMLRPLEKIEYTKEGKKERYILNQRFAWDIYYTEYFLGIRKRSDRITDVKTNYVLAEYIDFSSGQNSLEPDEFRDYKFWIYTKSCSVEGSNVSRRKFHEFMHLVKYQKRITL